MSDKSVQKKKYIVETARKVFAAKGFKTVTMKDVVEACDISRGGLYIYFDSTESLFEEVLKNELLKSDTDVETGAETAITNSDILTLFFRQQKKDILNNRDSLIIAMYEYCFMTKTTGAKTLMDKEVYAASSFLEKLLKAGNSTGEFEVEDPKKTARNMVYVLEGLKLLNRTGDISEKMIDDEFVFLLQGILPAK